MTEITARTGIIYMLMFVLFVSVFISLLLPGLRFVEIGVSPDGSWPLIFAGSAGAFGAAFSMMTGLRKRLADSTFDDLTLNRRWWLILTRVLVGVGAGFVLLFSYILSCLTPQYFRTL